MRRTMIVWNNYCVAPAENVRARFQIRRNGNLIDDQATRPVARAASLHVTCSYRALPRSRNRIRQLVPRLRCVFLAHGVKGPAVVELCFVALKCGALGTLIAIARRVARVGKPLGHSGPTTGCDSLEARSMSASAAGERDCSLTYG